MTQELAQLGSVGILALTVLAIARSIAPLIRLLAENFKNMHESNNALLKRLEDSDKVIEHNTDIQLKTIRVLDANTATTNTVASNMGINTDVINGMRLDLQKLVGAQTGLIERIDPLLERVERWDKTANEMKATGNSLVSTANEMHADLIRITRELVDAVNARQPVTNTVTVTTGQANTPPADPSAETAA